MKKLFLLLSAVGVIFTACEGGGFEEENGGTPSTPKIELSQQSVEVEFEPAKYEVAVTSPYSWEAKAKNGWIEIETRTGIAGTKILKFSVTRNEGVEIREGTIVIKNEDYNLVAELYVTQKAFVPAITIEPESLAFAVEGGTQEIAITTNFEYTYNENADWLTIEKSEKGISVTVPNYVEVDERTAEITISNEKYGVSKVVKATQRAFAPAITIEPESLAFTFEGGTQDVAITANFEYAYSENADWLTIEKSESGIKVTAKINTNFEERTTEIIISSEKYGVSKTIAVTQKGVSAESKNVIIYTSSNGKVVTPSKSDVFGANIVSNIYSNGQGIIIFDAPVTSIGIWAFENCTSLTSVIIPDSVTSIGDYAFCYCTSLTSVTIPNSVTSIGIWAFENCTSLTSVTIPDSVTSIGEWAFYECSSLTSVTIPDSITLIGECAFYGCTSLTSVIIPDSVTSIGGWAFSGCKSLTSVTIPDSVTSIGMGAFSGCTSLKAFYSKFASSDNRCLIVDGILNSFAIGYGLTQYTIPDSVTLIGECAFYECTSLKSVIIPNSVTEIGRNAFFGCTSLTSVTIPDSVTSIGREAFSGCSPLTSVTIPDSVTSIGEYAFSDCTSLTSVYCKPTTPPTAIADWGYWYAFDDNASGRKIYVPRNSVDAYKTAQYWSVYASDIEGYDF